LSISDTEETEKKDYTRRKYVTYDRCKKIGQKNEETSNKMKSGLRKVNYLHKQHWLRGMGRLDIYQNDQFVTFVRKCFTKDVIYVKQKKGSDRKDRRKRIKPYTQRSGKRFEETL
jgi:hypothetical protein